MVTPNDIAAILKTYDIKNLRIGSLGGHSALDVCRGAKTEGFETVVVAQRGREQTYTRHFKTRSGADARGCVDHVIVVDSFADIVKSEVQQQLRDLNVLFVHSRYFWTYCDYSAVETDFLVPILGNRQLVRKEERDEPRNQYFLLEKAGILTPRQFARPADIDRTVIVKASETTADRSYERAFFLASSPAEYRQQLKKLIATGRTTEAAAAHAVIEEFVLGPQINLNFFYSPLANEVELMGTDTRRQTNLDGLLRLTAPEQIEVLKHIQPQYIENGHQTVTIKESLLEKTLDAGERFAKTVAQYYPPGMIGPFALQGAITAGPPKEEFVTFDVSMRIPGSPGIMFTPYTGYLYGENISVGRRIAREVVQARAAGKLAAILT